MAKRKKTRIVVDLIVEGDPEIAWRTVDSVLNDGTFQDAISERHTTSGDSKVTVRQAIATTARTFVVGLVDEALGNAVSPTAVATVTPSKAHLEDLHDAALVLSRMGFDRRMCKNCKRATVVPGYICWNCSADNSKD